MRKLRKIAEDELKQILEQHTLWLKTGGEQGERARLNHVNLRGVDLSGFDLQRVNFQDTNLQYVNLFNANLQYADLFNANLEDADLRGSNLQDAYLDHSDLRGVKFDHGILECKTLIGTKWLKTDIPWYIQHSDYSKWANTIEILDD